MGCSDRLGHIMTLTFHTQVTHRITGIWDRQLALARGGNIPGMTLVLGLGVMDEATRVIESFLASKRPFTVVGRITGNGVEDKYKNLYGTGDPTALGKQWAKEFLSHIFTLPLKEQTTARYIYWQPWDEVKARDGFAKEDYTWHSKFDIAAMDAMIEADFRYAAVNLYWGNPNHPPYYPIDEWDYFWDEIKAINFYGSDKVIVQLHAYIDGCSIQAPQDFALDRPQYLIKRLRKAGLSKVKIALGETGLTAVWSACKGYTYPQYAKDLIVADLEHFRPFPEILMAGIFTLDRLDGNYDSRGRYQKDFPADGEIFDTIETYLLGLGAPSTPPAPPAPPTIPPPQERRFVRIVLERDDWNVNIRSGPGTNNPVVVMLPNNLKIEIDYVTSNRWAHLSDKIRGKDVFVYYALVEENPK
jgi:hypothetical protein